jgi:hypothetical protein
MFELGVIGIVVLILLVGIVLILVFLVVRAAVSAGMNRANKYKLRREEEIAKYGSPLRFNFFGLFPVPMKEQPKTDSQPKPKKEDKKDGVNGAGI